MILDHLSFEQEKCLEALASSLNGNNQALAGSRIFDLLDRFILDDEQQQVLGLNPWNIFFMGAAAHMAETGYVSEEEVKLHGLDILDEKQTGILSGICDLLKADMDGAAEFQDAEADIYKDQPINIPLIAGAVRLASELNMASFDSAENQPGFDIIAMGPHPFLSGTIRVRIRCRNFGVHRALKNHENRVQRFLHQINGYVSPRFLFSEVIFEIEPEGYTPLDMKFSVDSMAALRLLTGNRLYSDDRVFLRELVQNAVDACNLKRIFYQDYEPEITIEFDPEYKTIRFTDNGIGMDRQWIEKYFLKVGISFYQSGDMKTIHKSRMDCNFISKFGIGFLSSFLAADKVVIRTRKENYPGLIITIHSLEEYFDVRFDSEDCAYGTEVTLFMSEANIGFSRSMDYVCYLKNNLRFLSVPVELTDHRGQTATLGHEQLAYQRENKTGIDFVAPLGFKDSEGYLFLKVKENLGTLYALDYARGGISIFQDGIFVTQMDSLLPEGARQSIIGRINLTGEERCEISMDRNRIFWNDDQLSDLKRTIGLGIVDLVNRVMDSTDSTGAAMEMAQSLVNHMAIFFDFNQIKDDMYFNLPPSIRQIVAKRFRDFIRINFPHTRDNRHVPEADGYAEQWQEDILASFAERSRPPLPA